MKEVRPFAESGTNHFFPDRLGGYNLGGLDVPYTSLFEGPVDISKPAWCFKPPDRTPGDWANGGTVIDAQKNVIFGSLNSNTVTFLLPDGTKRGEIQLLEPPGVFTPVLFGQSVCFSTGIGMVYCFDLATLEMRWRVKVFEINKVSGTAETVADGRIYLVGVMAPGAASDDTMVALNAEDGSVIWSTTLPQPAYNAFPQVMEGPTGKVVICGTMSGGLMAISAADGSITFQWHPPYSSFSTAGPTVGPGGRVYVASNLAPDPRTGDSKGSLRCFKLGDENPIKWELEFELQLTQVPIVVPKELVGVKGGDIVVVGAGRQLCGTQGDFMYLQAQKAVRGKLFGLDSETGKERWCFQPPPMTTAYPAGGADGDLCPPDAWSGATLDRKGTIYVCYQSGFVYAISAKTGKELSRYYTGADANGQPAIAPGMLVVFSFDRITVWRDPQVEEQWRAANSEDPRAKAELPPLRGTDVSEDLVYPPPPKEKRMFPELPPIPEAKPKVATESKEGSIWVVVGGGDKGGIVVRKGEGLKTAELGRISSGSKIKELEKIGERLHYEKVEGDGPDFGWVSLMFKSTPLIQLE